jgi:hypothetical protein
MSLDLEQFAQYIIRPTLADLGLYSVQAGNLLLGTAMVESGLKYVRQLGGGPALGVYQMEPATYHDIFRNYLDYRPALRTKVKVYGNYEGDLVGNLKYATALARIHYLRVPDAIPTKATYMAGYHKRWYNTLLGKTDVGESIKVFRKVVDGDYF